VNDKNKLWRDWWANVYAKNSPAGSYNPMEGHMWESWNAGWDAALKTTCPPCNGHCNQGRDCPARE